MSDEIPFTPPAEITPRKEDDFTLPAYADRGRILVEVLSGPHCNPGYRWETEVLDYDGDSSVFWITEGVGFDFWFDSVDFPGLGLYVIEDVHGNYTRGDGWMTDDDEDWYHADPRPAAVEESVSRVLGPKL